jgi:hypothetical protein
MPRFIHVKPKAKPEEVDAFQTSNSFLMIIYLNNFFSLSI